MTAFVLIRSNGWEIVFVQTDLPCEIMGLLRIWRWWNSVTHVISIEGSLSYFLLKSSLMKRDHTASIMAPSSRDNKRIHGSATDFNNRSCLETCAWTKWIAWIEQVNRAIKIYGLNKLLSKSSYSNYHTMCIKRRCRKQKKRDDLKGQINRWGPGDRWKSFCIVFSMQRGVGNNFPGETRAICEAIVWLYRFRGWL